ncbi:hypothetical protein ACCQ13_07760 [Xanthomonas sp. NCPPB 1638]|uniref:hypothetical protein n=1 Tax=Xanthomonas sp. NCPPB 1638 TaxID=487535 RepID=UPI003558DE23
MSSEKYIRILSCSSASTDIQSRYVRWHDVLQDLDVPWGMRGVDIKKVKPSPSGHIGVTYRMNKGVKSFGVDFYQDRLDMDSEMGVAFDAAKFNGSLDYVWDVVIPKYVEAMHPYKLTVEDSRLLTEQGALLREMPYAERMAYRNRIKSERDQLRNVWQVNYWAGQQCKNYFGISPEAVVSKLSGHVVKAILLGGGPYIIYSYDVMGPEDVAVIDPVIRKLLI